MPSIIADAVKPSDGNIELVETLLTEENEEGLEKMQKHGAKLAELDNAGNHPLLRMASWGFTDLDRKFGKDASLLDVAWTKRMALLNVKWRDGRLQSILHTAITRSMPNMRMVRLLVLEIKVPIDKSLSISGDKHLPALHLPACTSHRWQIHALEFFWTTVRT